LICLKRRDFSLRTKTITGDEIVAIQARIVSGAWHICAYIYMTAARPPIVLEGDVRGADVSLADPTRALLVDVKGVGTNRLDVIVPIDSLRVFGILMGILLLKAS
jgi:hypothetical protein